MWWWRCVDVVCSAGARHPPEPPVGEERWGATPSAAGNCNCGCGDTAAATAVEGCNWWETATAAAVTLLRLLLEVEEVDEVVVGGAAVTLLRMPLVWLKGRSW